jgi:hypothetical protein
MTHTFDSERVLRLLTADVGSTLGRELLPDVLDVAANVGALAVMHIDTSWPTCPRHPHHPMDYREAIDAWCCPRDGAAIVRLGELAPRSR